MCTELVQALESKDPAGGGHSERVIACATKLAATMGLPRHEMPFIRVGTYLHDIGKIAIPDQVLFKSGKLTSAEYADIQRHPDIGFQILKPVFGEVEPRVLDIVRFHHERWDGQGYPLRLKRDSIPLWARICGLADAWDAMTGPRVYRRPFSREQALLELKKCAGTQFDPELVKAFAAEVVPQLKLSPPDRPSEPWT